MNETKRLVLASGSKRRRDLIAALDTEVEIVPPEGENDTRFPGEPPGSFVIRLAKTKARDVAPSVGPAIVIGADTTVVLDDDILNKPQSNTEAVSMLERLRGREHRVVTGVAVMDSESGLWLASAVTTKVRMRRYKDTEIAAYVLTGEPFDKAGAYAIQDETFRPVESIEGCYLNVVGFPLYEVEYLLNGIGVEVSVKKGWSHPQMCGACREARRQGLGKR
ncbi:MAG: septum formation protein Maf [SAR202 cluster bacterium]|nr:septum formation protein Maf [SAR202 cluster bacterium]